MILRFTYPAGAEGWTEDLTVDEANPLLAVPRVGELVGRGPDGEDEYEVRHVVHYPWDQPPMVYIVLRKPTP